MQWKLNTAWFHSGFHGDWLTYRTCTVDNPAYGLLYTTVQLDPDRGSAQWSFVGSIMLPFIWLLRQAVKQLGLRQNSMLYLVGALSPLVTPLCWRLILWPHWISIISLWNTVLTRVSTSWFQAGVIGHQTRSSSLNSWICIPTAPNSTVRCIVYSVRLDLNISLRFYFR